MQGLQERVPVARQVGPDAPVVIYQVGLTEYSRPPKKRPASPVLPSQRPGRNSPREWPARPVTPSPLEKVAGVTGKGPCSTAGGAGCRIRHLPGGLRGYRAEPEGAVQGALVGVLERGGGSTGKRSCP